MNIDATQVSSTSQLSKKIADTEELLSQALSEFAEGQIALSFSGAEDVVLIDLVQSLGLHVDVFRWTLTPADRDIRVP